MIIMESTGFKTVPEGENYHLTNARTAAKHIKLGWGKLAPAGKKAKGGGVNKVLAAITEAIAYETEVLKKESKGKKIVKPSTKELEDFNLRVKELEKKEADVSAREEKLKEPLG